MATIFPLGNDPLIFSATLPAGGTDTSNAPLGGQQASPLTTTAPGGSMSLAFLIFAYPNGNSDAGGNPLPPPQTPLVEVRTGRGPWQMLQVTAGTGGAPLSLGDPANNLIADYTMASPDANGVVQIAFQQNNAPFGQQAWDIRFTINDGVTSAAAQKGLTFVVDAADVRAPWLAVPGQLTLSAAGPAPIDFASALKSITLAGPADAGSADQLDPGQTYTVLLPVGNYGAGPLTITSVTPADMTNGFSIRLLTAPLTITPGAVDTTTLQATFQAPPAGQSGGAAAPTAFALACDDPLAAGSGATAHFNIVSLSARTRGPAGPAPKFAPSHHQFEETALIPGLKVGLFGTNFDLEPVVRFGTIAARVIDISSSELVVIVPPMPPGPVNITVTTSAGSVTSDDKFTVLPEAAPKFAPSPNKQFSPTFGSTGSAITLFGSNFFTVVGENVRVLFGTTTTSAVPAKIVAPPTPSQIVAEAPDLQVPGEYLIIVVQGGGGSVTSDDLFTFVP